MTLRRTLHAFLMSMQNMTDRFQKVQELTVLRLIIRTAISDGEDRQTGIIPVMFSTPVPQMKGRISQDQAIR